VLAVGGWSAAKEKWRASSALAIVIGGSPRHWVLSHQFNFICNACWDAECHALQQEVTPSPLFMLCGQVRTESVTSHGHPRLPQCHSATVPPPCPGAEQSSTVAQLCLPLLNLSKPVNQHHSEWATFTLKVCFNMRARVSVCSCVTGDEQKHHARVVRGFVACFAFCDDTWRLPFLTCSATTPSTIYGRYF
jgi:hypothetical protein